MGRDDTMEQSWNRAGRDAPESLPRPGVVKVFSAGAAAFVPRALDPGRPLVIGRGSECDLVVDDVRMSRRHAELRFLDGSWQVKDLESRNGTFLDGKRVSQSSGRWVRLAVGDTLFLLCDDLRPMLAESVELRDAIVVGPTLRRAWREIERAAQSSAVLHLHGESGSGKELAARVFHESGPRARGAFVAVNCAAVPPALAERLLFGARRGAYTGADVDSDGYLGASDGGTLFLDEICELPAEVQAKLLRVIENRELLPLGAARPRKIDFGVVSASHGDLRAQVAAGRFREDLYFRVGRPLVTLPPLRERLEEMPFLVERLLGQQRPPLQLHVSFVEAVLERAWPGNVRELVHATVEAARRAAGSARVEAVHLDAESGRALHTPAASPPSGSPIVPDDVRIRETLEREHGNVSRAARALGMHRTQLRRWMARQAGSATT